MIEELKSSIRDGSFYNDKTLFWAILILGSLKVIIIITVLGSILGKAVASTENIRSEIESQNKNIFAEIKFHTKETISEIRSLRKSNGGEMSLPIKPMDYLGMAVKALEPLPPAPEPEQKGQ